MTPAADLGALARGVIGIGFHGACAGEAPLDALRAFAPGALILFARNVGPTEHLRALIDALRAGAAPPPLIMVDQEGGRVERIRDGVAALPSAMALGATHDPALVQRIGALLGAGLRGLGVSVDLAPVADLALQPQSTVIATRAYGDDPEHVALMASAFARGLESAGIAATLKHFPGHGSTADDSHVGLPHIALDAATLRARDLVPFARAIAARAASIVMTAHVVVEGVDASRPATVSPRVLRELLREELGFSGVIATDCLEMDAISGGIGTVRAAVEALAAGADLLLISHRLDLAREAAQAIVRAVEAGEVPRARLEDAHARIAALRARLASAPPAASVDDAGVVMEAAHRAITLVRGAAELPAERAVTVISFEGAAVDHAAASGARAAGDATPTLSAMLRRRGWKSEVMRVPLDPESADIDLLVEHLVALGERSFVVVTRDAHLHAAQARAVARIIETAPNAVIVSGGAPFDALLWPAARTVLCAYGTQPVALEACADVLSGRAVPGGTLPVRVVPDVAVR